jgi:hypothetical protein
VQHSDALRDYLNFVREVGNFVNDGGFAGNAAGFGVCFGCLGCLGCLVGGAPAGL